MSVKSADSKQLSVLPRTVWTAVLGLLLLRLCIGLHFFCEGTKKLTFNEVRSEWEFNAPTEALFGAATGPFADYYQSFLPDFHDWETLLAVPQQFVPLTPPQIAERQKWTKEYQKRRATAEEAGEPIPVEFPEYAPYANWAGKIIDDLRGRLKQFTDVKGITKEQAAEAAELFQQRHQQLADFLSEEEEGIVEYQHELWRLETLEEQKGSQEIPYLKERVSSKLGETLATGRTLVNEVKGIERGLINDILGVLTPEQLADTGLLENVGSALNDPQEQRLEFMNKVVTFFLIGIGGCLMLGFLTRIASLGGILFLLSVMVTQLPWVPGSRPDYFYYQLVECTALLAILGYGAWRLPGIDYVLRGCCSGCCSVKKKS